MSPESEKVLALPMQQPNDADAATIRDYLVKLLATLREEGECFGGKLPLGNSGWEWDLFIPLVRAGFISGTFEVYDGEETGGLDECDDAAGTGLIAAAIQALGKPDEQPRDEDADDMQREMAIEIIGMLVAPNPCRRDGDVCVAHGYSVKDMDCPQGHARAFLAGAEPTRRKWQAERDADMRAVDRLLRELRINSPGVSALKAVTRVEECFADRIAELREREGGEGA